LHRRHPRYHDLDQFSASESPAQLCTCSHSSSISSSFRSSSSLSPILRPSMHPSSTRQHNPPLPQRPSSQREQKRHARQVARSPATHKLQGRRGGRSGQRASRDDHVEADLRAIVAVRLVDLRDVLWVRERDIHTLDQNESASRSNSQPPPSSPLHYRERGERRGERARDVIRRSLTEYRLAPCWADSTTWIVAFSPIRAA